jgi:putative ABC transport system permease protein
MRFADAIRLALRVVWTQKMKSSFSVLGVFVGVTFLIAVWSVIAGMNSYMTERFAGALLGVNTFQLRRFPDFQTSDVSDSTWRAWVRRPRITYDDAEAVVATLEPSIRWSWVSQAAADVEYRGRVAARVRVAGTNEQYFDVKGWQFSAGRPFTAQEARSGQPVVVMGYDLAQRIFGGLDPLRREIRIRGMPYRVIGIVESQGNLFGMSLDNFVVAPATSPVRRFVNPPNVIDELVVKASAPLQMEAAMDQVVSVMRTRRHLGPSEPNSFAVETASGILDFWGKINAILMIALPGLVSISLVVGGIVIMNIMLMAVAERTREIGIRKALGAKRRDIMAQFVVESATLSTVGAAIGILAGIGLAFVIRALTPLPAAVAPWSVGLGVFLGVAVGMAAGIYPASRASKLDPIVALRSE